MIIMIIIIISSSSSSSITISNIIIAGCRIINYDSTRKKFTMLSKSRCISCLPCCRGWPQGSFGDRSGNFGFVSYTYSCPKFCVYMLLLVLVAVVFMSFVDVFWLVLFMS